MADPPVTPQPASDEPEGADPEARALIVRALQYRREGRRLPRPSTWKELLVGMVVWLGDHWSDEHHDRLPCGNCGGRDWEFGPVVSFDADPRWPSAEGDERGTYPYLQAGCRKCGNTIFINALLVFEPQVPMAPDAPSDP